MGSCDVCFCHSWVNNHCYCLESALYLVSDTLQQHSYVLGRIQGWHDMRCLSMMETPNNQPIEDLEQVLTSCSPLAAKMNINWLIQQKLDSTECLLLLHYLLLSLRGETSKRRETRRCRLGIFARQSSMTVPPYCHGSAWNINNVPSKVEKQRRLDNR